VGINYYIHIYKDGGGHYIYIKQISWYILYTLYIKLDTSITVSSTKFDNVLIPVE